MLQYLHIENIAVIEQANIEFKDGFNVMTGETGAGKSIIIDSLYAILGERTSRELIRHGCDRAVVSASFIDVGSEAILKLNELGYSLDSNEELIIQRVLFADGRGQVKINAQPANVSTLKEIGKLLINIHGQHDNQTLLNPEKHMSFIDAFAENEGLKDKYSSAFLNFKNITKELKSITENNEEKSKRAELLSFQIDEIEKANLTVGEAENLKQRIIVGQQSENILSAISESLVGISGNGDAESLNALDILNSSLKSLERISNVFEEAKAPLEALNALVLDLEGISFELSSLKENVDIDHAELENCRLRLDMIHDLMLKYGNTEQLILEYLSLAKVELDGIKTDNKRCAELEGLIEPAQQALIDAGYALSKSRKIAADTICKKICNELEFLDFNGAQFSAEVVQGRYTKTGCDTTEFLISANVGEVKKPLVKIASGGELSRIMLAIRSVLSLRDDVGTLIFDEIDSGISGHAAQKVAIKLYDVAKKRQVICVTHLAQIAAAADHHLFISKSVKDNKTYTKVEALNHNGRVHEIARIMSGGAFTENLLKTAEEMISLIKE